MSHLTRPQIVERQKQLVEMVRRLGPAAVAFSGGVDSAVVAKAVQIGCGSKGVAITGDSPSLARDDLQRAIDLAELIGLRHVVLKTAEGESTAYRQNAPDRCYHCKSELYTKILARQQELGFTVLLNGANADDQGDYRPGLLAASERQVRSPLADCGLGKEEIRQLAAAWNLPVWDAPASPCLASRLAYGQEVTPERLAMIEQAEQFLHQLGLREVRVRFHEGNLARIEVPADQIERLCQAELRSRVQTHFSELGFQFVTIDLAGFRSGSLNVLVPRESLSFYQTRSDHSPTTQRATP